MYGAIALLTALTWTFTAFATSGYQMNLNGGFEQVNQSESRKSAYYGQGQLATLTKFIRFQGTFTYLSGSKYSEAEGGMGLNIYPISQFVAERARIHPFLTATGTFGVGSYNKTARNDFGYNYGAGIDLKLWSRAGFTFSMQQHRAKEKGLRYTVGLFWFRSD